MTKICGHLPICRFLVRQAKSVKDVLDIEERIRGLEEEIESAEGRLSLLGNQIAYSTFQGCRRKRMA